MRYRILRLRASPSPFPDFWQTSLRPHGVLAHSLSGETADSVTWIEVAGNG